MKKKWIILIVIGVILLLGILGFLAYNTVSKLQQKSKLTMEMNEIATIIASNEYTEESINKRLDSRVTKGDYGKVENAAKSYLKDVIQLNLELIDLIKDDRIGNMLTVENYEEDGPEFTNTKAYLDTTIQRLEEMKTDYAEYMAEEKIMSYIEKENVDEYYQELYKTVMGESQYEEISTSLDELISVLNKSNDIINFLKENGDSWEIQNDMIVFSTNELINEYNSLVDKLAA